MSDRLLPPRGGRNPLDLQVHFNETFGILYQTTHFGISQQRQELFHGQSSASNQSPECPDGKLFVLGN